MFTLRFGVTLLVAAVAAALIAPFVAAATAALGLHFPFPRIFDRVVMVSLAIVLWMECRKLKLVARLRTGFAQPPSGLSAIGYGLVAGAGAMAVLWGLAWLTAPAHAPGNQESVTMTLAASLLPAMTIALIEEGFFRAFLLDGMADDFGTPAALIASSAVYAAAHLVRSPKRFEVVGVHPMLGLQTLGASLSQLGHPRAAAPGFIGLFLLGLVLGKAFTTTGRVYFSIGLHASLVAGAKTFRTHAPGAQSAPRWLSGWGRQPLVSGAAAWVIAVVLLIAVGRLAHRDGPTGARAN